MSVGEARKEMNAAIRAFLLPRLREVGFKGSAPHFRRIGADRIDLLTLQFDKWGGAFCVNIAVCPPADVTDSLGNPVSPAKVTAYDVNPPRRQRLTLNDSQSDCWLRYSAGGFLGDFRGSPEACAKTAANAILDRGEEFFRSTPRWWLTNNP